jgi:hypothetical protein
MINEAVGGGRKKGEREPTIAKMTIQMGRAGKLCRAIWTKLRLRELWDVSPMRAHARDRSVLLVLDRGLPWRHGRRQHGPLL